VTSAGDALPDPPMDAAVLPADPPSAGSKRLGIGPSADLLVRRRPADAPLEPYRT